MTEAKRILVVGGGPAGMTAALTAARRGHQVTLLERMGGLGGQLRHLTRAVVGRWVEHLTADLKDVGVEVHTDLEFSVGDLDLHQPDAVVLATGAEAYVPDIDLPLGGALTALDVLDGAAVQGDRVLVYDWRGDWTGVAVSELLESAGKDVELVTGAYGTAEVLQQYVRNQTLARLDRSGITLTPGFKVAAADADGITLRHLFSGREERRTGRTLVLSCGGDASASLALYRGLNGSVPTLHRIGDALAPRSLDEATLEGFETGKMI